MKPIYLIETDCGDCYVNEGVYNDVDKFVKDVVKRNNCKHKNGSCSVTYVSHKLSKGKLIIKMRFVITRNYRDKVTSESSVSSLEFMISEIKLNSLLNQ